MPQAGTGRPFDAFTVSALVIDDRGKKARMSWYMPKECTIRQVQDFSYALIEKIDELQHGRVYGLNIAFPSAPPFNIKAFVDPRADNEEKMTLTFTNAKLAIPAFNDEFAALSLQKKGTRILDFLQDEPTALLNLIRAPVTFGFVYGVSDHRGKALGDFVASRQTFLRTRR